VIFIAKAQLNQCKKIKYLLSTDATFVLKNSQFLDDYQ